MFKLTTTATALIPSGFAMPACGHAWIDTTGVIAGAATMSSVRLTSRTTEPTDWELRL